VKNKNFILLAVLLVITSSIVVYSADAAGIPKKAISTVARFLESDLPTTTVFTDIANTFGAGQKQTFTSSSTTAGLNIVSSGSDPSSLADGDVWLNGATLKYRGSGATKSLVTSAITSINSDATAAQTIQGTAGNTTVSTSSGTTTVNTGTNVVVTGGSAQTITKGVTINSLTLGGAENANSQRITSLGTPTTATDAEPANRMGLLGNKVTSTCASGQVLKYQTSNSTWICANPGSAIYIPLIRTAATLEATTSTSAAWKIPAVATSGRIAVHVDTSKLKFSSAEYSCAYVWSAAAATTNQIGLVFSSTPQEGGTTVSPISSSILTMSSATATYPQTFTQAITTSEITTGWVQIALNLASSTVGPDLYSCDLVLYS